MSPSHPILLLGGGNIGSVETSAFHTVEAVESLLLEAKDHGVNRIDTAGRYPSDNIGESERLLGQAGVASQGFLVDTKILFEGTDPSGPLSLGAIRKSVPESLRKLQVDKLNTLYNHIGDPTTPLEEQVSAMDEQYRSGVCNQACATYLPDMVSNWLKICDEKGYTKPKIYQGMYNFIRRDAETSLFPILRDHGMNFIAFGPLAAGFLTGNFTKGNVQGTRAEGNGAISNAFRAVWGGKPELHEAMNRLHTALEPHGINSIEAVLRWLSYHSQLGPDDGIILGASKTGQLERNVEAIRMGPLPQQVVQEIEGVWAALENNK